MNKYIMIIGLILVSFIGINYINLYQHEKTHEAISKNYGCQSYKTHVGLFQGYFKCLDARTETENEKFLQSYNEIVTYNNQTISMTIVLMTIILIYAMFVVKHENK